MQIRQTIAGAGPAKPNAAFRGLLVGHLNPCPAWIRIELRYTCRASCCLRPEVLLEYNAVLIDNNAHDA
jgi:hypothetical protein